MTSQPTDSAHKATDKAFLPLILDKSGGKVWPTPEYEVMMAVNQARCPKPVGKERKARHRAAIAMLETIEDIRDELGRIHTFLLHQACPDDKYILQVFKYYLRLSRFLRGEADNFLVYEQTNTGLVAVDADIKGLAVQCDLAKSMRRATVLMHNEPGCEASTTSLQSDAEPT